MMSTAIVSGVTGVVGGGSIKSAHRVTKPSPSSAVMNHRPAYRQPTDETLIRSFVINGDEKGFVTLVERYAEQIRGILYTLLNGSIEDIYDAEQEVMMSLFRSLRRFAFRSRFSTYLYRLCTNVAINYLRGIKRSHRTTDHLQHLARVEQREQEAASDSLERREEWDYFQVAFAKLNERDKIIIQLRIFEERPVEECAAILQIAEGSVKSRLNRARSRLATLISNERGGKSNHG